MVSNAVAPSARAVRLRLSGTIRKAYVRFGNSNTRRQEVCFNLRSRRKRSRRRLSGEVRRASIRSRNCKIRPQDMRLNIKTRRECILIVNVETRLWSRREHNDRAKSRASASLHSPPARSYLRVPDPAIGRCQSPPACATLDSGDRFVVSQRAPRQNGDFPARWPDLYQVSRKGGHI